VLFELEFPEANIIWKSYNYILFILLELSGIFQRPVAFGENLEFEVDVFLEFPCGSECDGFDVLLKIH
jgi:hypothetical protein